MDLFGVKNHFFGNSFLITLSSCELYVCKKKYKDFGYIFGRQIEVFRTGLKMTRFFYRFFRKVYKTSPKMIEYIQFIHAWIRNKKTIPMSLLAATETDGGWRYYGLCTTLESGESTDSRGAGQYPILFKNYVMF